MEAAVFAIIACGYEARCALEDSDSGTPRLQRIIALIRECRLSIHDFSRTGANPHPRFNMPFEFGLVLGARYYGQNAQRRKRCLVVATERHDYQRFISDISGQDIEAHHDSETELIAQVRQFLRGDAGRRSLPGPAEIGRYYQAFKRDLPRLCQLPQFRYDLANLHIADHVNLISAFLSEAGWEIV